jgi:hypothetical protein
MMAVISALSNSSISRLRKLWDSLSDKYHEIHQRLEDVMKPTSNFKVYREAISVKPKEMPVVPYLAVYLRDITFVCDGNPDRTSDGLVNFEKIQLLGSRIQEVQASTSTPYIGLTVDLSVRGLIKNLSFWEDDVLYEKSLECEALKGSGMHHMNGHGLSTITEENEEDDQLSEGGSESTTNSSPGVETWSIAEVSSWMESIGKGKYREVFEQHRINGSRLVLLDDPTLGAMGMQRLGHRKRLLKDILELSAPKSSPSTPSSSYYFPSPTSGLRNTMSAPVLTEEIVLGWGQPAIDSWVSSFHDPDITNSLKGISAHALLALSHETLVARGLDKLGLRKKVLKGVQSLKQSVSTENIYHTDASQWTVNDVLSWLERSDHGDYKNLFIARKSR